MTSPLTRDRWKRIRLVAIATLAVPLTMALVPTAPKPEDVGSRPTACIESMKRSSGTSTDKISPAP